MHLNGATKLDIEIRRLKRTIARVDIEIEELGCYDCEYMRHEHLAAGQTRRRTMLAALEKRRKKREKFQVLAKRVGEWPTGLLATKVKK